MTEQTLIVEALRLLREQDSLAAIEFLVSQEAVLSACQSFFDAMRHAYWHEKDVHAAVVLGWAGAQFGLVEAARGQHNAELAYDLRSVAKGVAYDVASFTWPGWNEPDLQPSPADLALGLDAAKINLRLARTLEKGDLPMSRACWMLGAHYLAIGDYAAAEDQFAQAGQFAHTADAVADELLNQGFLFSVEV